jgi:hypothetical protein
MSWIGIGILIGIGLILAPLVLSIALGGATVLLELISEVASSLWRLAKIVTPFVVGCVLGLPFDLVNRAPPYTMTLLGGLIGVAVIVYRSERKLWG